ncbi:hypothetical protein E0Z10_g303 [Xylaria hypoxylon]|uniref:Alkaline phosphatase n=1 Tax=Xylaria hypoxylon TaxID=37992 RepID=A0A4Z0ZFE4_9PEZI|nr:hypothetical protein E0Z10_g303 [Xylaria hypoxylon]
MARSYSDSRSHSSFSNSMATESFPSFPSFDATNRPPVPDVTSTSSAPTMVGASENSRTQKGEHSDLSVDVAFAPKSAPNLTPLSPTGVLRRRNTRTNTFRTLEEFEDFERGWRTGALGAEPGIDPKKPDGGQDVVPDLHAECQITVVDFSQEDLKIHELNNLELIEFVRQPQPSWVQCRWINVNGLSWYPGHAFLILACLKLVRLVDDDSDSDDETEFEEEAGESLLRNTGKKLKRWISGKKKQHPTTASVLEKGTGQNTAGHSFTHQPTGLSDLFNPNKLRTLQRYHSAPNAARTEYMEKHSALATKGLAVSAEQVAMFITSDNTVIAFFEQSADNVEEPILARLKSPTTILRKSCDASMVAQALIDAIIDMAIPVTACYADIVGDLEVDVLTHPNIKHTKNLYIIISEINKVFSFINPIQALISSLRDHKTKLSQEAVSRELQNPLGGVIITPVTYTYLGDVYDHCVLITENLTQIKESANHMIDLIFNTIATYQNESMKQLTIATIIFLPLTFITGYFGQNFGTFPEADKHDSTYFWKIAIPVVANTTTPLLANHRRSSANSESPLDSEEDALRGQSSSPSWPSRLREALLFAWALLATAAVLVLAVWVSHKQQTNFDKHATKRNLIFMVSDGMGPASLSLTRSFRQHTEDLEYGDTLTLDKHFWGTSRTRSSSSLVTDSAAGATAFSCARKSYNGAISMLPGYTPCGTVLEAAKKAGYITGLVVTTDITDATPACFASHVNYRIQQDEIALQEIGQGPLDRVVDLMLGGGRCHFLPNTTDGGCRQDSIDVIELAQKEYGWNYIGDRVAFDEFWEGKKEVPLPMLGLFAPADIPFELDRRNMNDQYPSLSEMAKTALRALEKATEKSDKGFFLMIEGSRIDHAGHGNDPSAQVREVLEYDKTFQAVLDFLDESKTDGVLVATSDHETGGLAVARQINAGYPQYLWYPQVLANATASSEHLARRLWEHIAESDDSTEVLKNYINEELVIPGLGIPDATEDELAALALYPELAQPAFAEMISVRAQIGWSTHGHSAVDVNIYSSGGPGTDALRGNVENTDVGEFLRGYLNVDVDAVTKELNEKMGSARTEPVLDEAGAAELDHWASREAMEYRRVSGLTGFA